MQWDEMEEKHQEKKRQKLEARLSRSANDSDSDSDCEFSRDLKGVSDRFVSPRVIRRRRKQPRQENSHFLSLKKLDSRSCTIAEQSVHIDSTGLGSEAVYLESDYCNAPESRLTPGLDCQAASRKGPADPIPAKGASPRLEVEASTSGNPLPPSVAGSDGGSIHEPHPKSHGSKSPSGQASVQKLASPQPKCIASATKPTPFSSPPLLDSDCYLSGYCTDNEGTEKTPVSVPRSVRPEESSTPSPGTTESSPVPVPVAAPDSSQTTPASPSLHPPEPLTPTREDSVLKHCKPFELTLQRLPVVGLTAPQQVSSTSDHLSAHGLQTDSLLPGLSQDRNVSFHPEVSYYTAARPANPVYVRALDSCIGHRVPCSSCCPEKAGGRHDHQTSALPAPSVWPPYHFQPPPLPPASHQYCEYQGWTGSSHPVPLCTAQHLMCNGSSSLAMEQHGYFPCNYNQRTFFPPPVTSAHTPCPGGVEGGAAVQCGRVNCKRALEPEGNGRSNEPKPKRLCASL